MIQKNNKIDKKENKLINKKNSIKKFKEKYNTVREIFGKYLIFSQRLKSTIFENEKKEYWMWYVEEINIVLQVMKQEESNFLKDHFLNNKKPKDMFISISKYYIWMNIVCKNFLTNLDSVFYKVQQQENHIYDNR